MALSQLRLEVVDAERFAKDDRGTFVTRPIAGRLLGVLHHEIEADDAVLSRIVQRDEARALGTDDELFAAALHNVADAWVEALDTLRVTDDCCLFVFQNSGVNLGARVLDVPSLIATVFDQLSPEAQKAARLGDHGALVAVPCEALLMMFVVDGGDLLTGAMNLVANVRENYDPRDENALSPWLYWVRGDQIEELEYEIDAKGDVESIDFPNALHALLRS